MPHGAVLVVPVGSCEQHGPHLPLGTDTRIAEALAWTAATRRSGAVVAPAVAVGAAGEHRGFPGTLSIGTDVLCEVVVELVRSALPGAPAGPGTAPPAVQRFGGVLLVNAHGGNVEALTRATDRLADEGRRVATWHAVVEGGDLHAGRTETSLMLHLHPDQVRMDDAEAGSTAPLSDISEVLRTDGLAAVSPNGVLGDPRGAGAEEGAVLFEQLLDSLLVALDVLGRGVPHPPARGDLRFRVD